MPHFHPLAPPQFLSERMRDAERAVWEIFQQLDYSWHVFYSARENSESGWDREVDFVLIRLNRIFYCEVKGGIVVVDRRAGPGVTWARQTRSGEAIPKRADPKQLWQAKAALAKTIYQIAGKSPRDLGFREHDFYIFPHTSREVTQGADLERGNVHYAFADDLALLPARLQQIVNSGKGQFIAPDRIAGIVNALDAMVVRDDAGVLPRPMSSASENAAFPSQPLTRPAPPIGKSAGPFRSCTHRPPSAWKAVPVLLVIFGFLSVAADSFSPLAVPKKTSAPNSPKPKAVSKSAMSEETGLPAFIAPVSADEVEQAIAAAQNRDIYVSWRSETQNGLVILLTTDDNGCRRYQVSRHDVQPVVYGFVRRCP